MWLTEKHVIGCWVYATVAMCVACVRLVVLGVVGGLGG